APQREQLLVRVQRREVRDVPVVRPGVVDAELHPRLAHGGAELLEQVAARAATGGVEGGGVAAPQAEAVMVLGGGDEVASASALGEAHDLLHAAGRRMPVVGEVLVGTAQPVELLVAGPGGAALDAHGVGVPLGVLVAGV